MIKLISAPIRSIVRFPLFQLAIVIGVILWLQAADDKSIFGELFNGLDKLADSTVQLVSTVFTIKSFTKAWLISGFMIAFVYLAGLLILSLVRLMIKNAIDFMGRSNFLYLRNAIARERGIEAYRAWLPLFQRPQPLGLGDVHPAVFGLPVVKRRLGDPVLASQVGRLGPSLVLVQHRDNLLFRKPFPLHLSVLRQVGL
jgi:hypothetical protein